MYTVHLKINAFKLPFRVVKRSSFCLNCVIISAILMGFIGTALYTIEPDDTTDSVAAVLVCNVRKKLTIVFLCV